MKEYQNIKVVSLLPINQDIKFVNTGLTSPLLGQMTQTESNEFEKDTEHFVKRKILKTGHVMYMNMNIPYTIYTNTFTVYKALIVYIEYSFQQITSESLLLFIRDKNYLSCVTNDNVSTLDTLTSFGIIEAEIERDFILIQVDQSYSNETEQFAIFLKNNKNDILQLLLRSNTEAKYIRENNHAKLLDNVSNFYGSFDFCSSNVVIQFYLNPISEFHSNVNRNEVSILERSTWWLVMIEIVLIQNSILDESIELLTKLENSQEKNKKKKHKNAMQTTKKIETILQKMKSFWYYDTFHYSISKAISDTLKNRIGINQKHITVTEQTHSLENRVLRELGEDQNRKNAYLNWILFAFATLQFLPGFKGFIDFVIQHKPEESYREFIRWVPSVSIFALPLLVFYVRKSNAVTTFLNTRNKD